LGIGCHRVLQSNADKFDFYGYMEDDLVIHDSFFFQKLSWFARKFGSQFLLQPHRYNRNVTPFDKDYLDMEFAKPAWNFKRSEKKLTATFLGEPLNFFSAANPHAACFFLTREQYRLMSDREDYAKPSGEFFTPLESAASLDISKTFYVYRVDFAAADFFSVEHIGERPYRIPGSEIDQADFAKYGYQFY